MCLAYKAGAEIPLSSSLARLLSTASSQEPQQASDSLTEIQTFVEFPSPFIKKGKPIVTIIS